MRTLGTLIAATIVIPIALSAFVCGADMKDVNARREQLKRLVAEEWEYELREAPEFATVIGDYRYNDRWSDLSLEHVQRQKADTEAWLARFRTLDTTEFSEQEKLSYDLMVRNLKERLEGIEFKDYEMPIDQFAGVNLMLPQFVTNMPFDSVKHYEDYITRLRQVPKVAGQLIEVLRQGEKDKLMPPRYLLDKTVTQCKSIAEPAGDANVFGQPATKIPESIAPAERKKLRDELIAAVDQQVRPAYAKLADFIATEYAPKGRTNPGYGHCRTATPAMGS